MADRHCLDVIFAVEIYNELICAEHQTRLWGRYAHCRLTSNHMMVVLVSLSMSAYFDAGAMQFYQTFRHELSHLLYAAQCKYEEDEHGPIFQQYNKLLGGT